MSIKEHSCGWLYGRLVDKKEHSPLQAQIILTYRCNLDCLHCYCKGSEDRERELSTRQWKKILSSLRRQGCLRVILTGGEPLIRKDFLELYSFAKRQGLLATIFTNATSFTREVVKHLTKSPPYSIEVTLNGITRETYESITQVENSFSKAISNIKSLRREKINLIIKSNCLKENQGEIPQIKAFTEKLLGRPEENRYCFQYGPMIYPRLNGDKSPIEHRISFKELERLRRKDRDIWQEYQRGICSRIPALKRDKAFLYHCNSWIREFFIDPYGQLKFCIFSHKFNIDLSKEGFSKEAYRKIFPRIRRQRFKGDSKCRDCELRPFCYRCPAVAYIETGDEEAPIPYYCEMAKKTKALIKKG